MGESRRTFGDLVRVGFVLLNGMEKKILLDCRGGKRRFSHRGEGEKYDMI